MTEIQKRLFELQDLKYRDFSAKLIPTVDKDRVIGVRVPVLRKFAKEVAKSDLKAEFMATLPHEYTEENTLHAFLIEQIKDFDECISALDNFLLFVDNWATCDSMSPKILCSDYDKFYEKIVEWAGSSHTYTVRFAIVMLMRYFIHKQIDEKHLKLLLGIKTDEYYINMAIAWYLATALATNWALVIPYIENQEYGEWVHNKAIQKAIESYRITPEQKEYLRTFKNI